MLTHLRWMLMQMINGYIKALKICKVFQKSIGVFEGRRGWILWNALSVKDERKMRIRMWSDFRV
jgi:hypothetical protein